MKKAISILKKLNLNKFIKNKLKKMSLSCTPAKILLKNSVNEWGHDKYFYGIYKYNK